MCVRARYIEGVLFHLKQQFVMAVLHVMDTHKCTYTHMPSQK